MNNIRKQINDLREIIKNSESKIIEIQENCPHENTHESSVSWRPAQSDPCIRCSDCDKVIKNLNYPNGYTVVDFNLDPNKPDESN